ncbi:stage III sporulation protein AE [Alkalibaculum sp. M08DMB]|uniref:Stage III sporulation protein AE n=1 Tax=Alkalibaculum sporogenes TaxID=2655001 RepID=A0A6A7K6S2_9FIRM|nr:stage III sporulation protein AE [Alkalibaculum sporogenes]MPW25140.1 stage III sporulation protein AE [Alkalibaculum sporogenes]
MIKKIILIMIFVMFVSSVEICASENTNENENENPNILENITGEFYEHYNIEELEEYYQESGLEGVISYPSIKDFVFGLVKGEINWDVQAMLDGIKSLLFNELTLTLNLLARIIFLSIMAAILKNISASFGKSQVGDIAFYVVYFVLIGMIANSFFTVVTLASTTIDTMVTFIQAILPTMFILLASVGAIASSSMLSPLVLYIVAFIGTVVNNVVYPLIIGAAVVSLIDHISSEIKLSNLAKLLKDAALYILGFLFVIFLGLVSIQGVAMATLDGLSAKTAKYAIDNFIPFVGGFLADSMDTIISASNIIKNGVGIVGLLIIVGIILFPIIKMFVLVIMFRVAAAIIQPISDERIVKCLSDMSSYILLIMGCVMVIAMMFFLIISIIVLLGDMTVMYR